MMRGTLCSGNNWKTPAGPFRRWAAHNVCYVGICHPALGHWAWVMLHNIALPLKNARKLSVGPTAWPRVARKPLYCGFISCEHLRCHLRWCRNCILLPKSRIQPSEDENEELNLDLIRAFTRLGLGLHVVSPTEFARNVFLENFKHATRAPGLWPAQPAAWLGARLWLPGPEGI